MDADAGLRPAGGDCGPSGSAARLSHALAGSASTSDLNYAALPPQDQNPEIYGLGDVHVGNRQLPGSGRERRPDQFWVASGLVPQRAGGDAGQAQRLLRFASEGKGLAQRSAGHLPLLARRPAADPRPQRGHVPRTSWT